MTNRKKSTKTEVIGIDITDVTDNVSVRSGYSSHSQNSGIAKKSLGGLTKLLNKARITSPALQFLAEMENGFPAASYCLL